LDASGPHHRLRVFREEVLKMSISEFALFLGSSRSMVSAVERGVRNPGRALSLRIRDASARLARKAAGKVKLPIRVEDWP
jgi:transcriptional regulator with XRE-family HTH domain